MVFISITFYLQAMSWQLPRYTYPSISLKNHLFLDYTLSWPHYSNHFRFKDMRMTIVFYFSFLLNHLLRMHNLECPVLFFIPKLQSFLRLVNSKILEAGPQSIQRDTLAQARKALPQSHWGVALEKQSGKKPSQWVEPPAVHLLAYFA